jgi:DNA-binding winged helix-turn-helix (wHTH) protein/TolB-like protein/Tfp pilus assembly protein PilF
MPSKQQLEKGFRVGDWEVTPGTGVLRKDDQEERPEPMVFKLLMLLAERDGDVLSKEDMIDEIWDGRPIGDEPITQKVSQLRKHLGDSRDPDAGRFRYVENLPKRGYYLNQPVELPEPIAPVNQQVPETVETRNQGWMWMLVGAVAAALLVAVFIDGRDPLVPAVAVMPFDFLSDSADDHYLAYAFQEEVIRTLQGAEGLVVKRVHNEYPGLEASDIGEILDADMLVFGTLQREGDMLKVGYLISDVDSGTDVGGDGFTGKLEGIFGLQEQFANMIRKELLGETEQQLVSASRPASYEAYDRYLRGLYALDRRSIDNNLDDAIELFDETTRIDPLFGPAYLGLAMSYALLPDYQNAPAEESYRLAVDTVERGVAVDESVRDISKMIYGFVYHKQRKPLLAEEAFSQAIQADIVDSAAFNWYARMLAGVGRKEAALEQALAAHRLDPGSSVINTLVATMYIWLDDNENAARFFERSNQLGSASQYDYFGYALMLIRQGMREKAHELVLAIPTADHSASGWVDPLFQAFEDPSHGPAAIAAMDEATRTGALEARVNMALRVFLGDVDGAMRMAKDLAGPGTHRPMDLLFLTELRPLREHPEFMDLMEMLGVKDYWDENGCMWLDDSVTCPD